MRMKKLLLLLVLICPIGRSLAAGLMLPAGSDYPKDLLRNRLIHVEVNIDGLIAQTSVYQEFVNESNDTTDAVYSFPLPPDARATRFLYWFDNKVYRAILKVREQAVNPGTGEGSIAAEINRYMGRNGIRIKLNGIPAEEIQRARLDYISMCDYFEGNISYRFPLETADFVTYPVEHVEFNVYVKSTSDIIDFDIPTHSDFEVIQNLSDAIALRAVEPKSYLDRDFEFNYSVEQSHLGTDFYSIASDSADGHFALVVRPEATADATDVLPTRMIFALSNSNLMFGYLLDQSIAAIKEALALLSEKDLFNIVLFNSSVVSWHLSPVAATAANVQAAKDFLDSVRTGGGSLMGEALRVCLEQMDDADFSNAILLLASGRSPIDPRKVAALNTYKAGIFAIGIGDNVDRARLEMTAAMNYGFVTYVDPEEGIRDRVVRLFRQINRPVLADVAMEFGRADLHDILPEKTPSTYAGSYFFSTGRYRNAGISGLSIAGKGATGLRAFDFTLAFSDQTAGPKFVESLWAKEKIDALEREIEIFGETNELKSQVVDLSLTYNIRSRYTAYVADYEEEFDGSLTGVETDETTPAPATFSILSNYPNPFNPSTRIRFFLDEQALDHASLIKIYNSVGQLVAVLDISHLASGWHEIEFDGRDMFGKHLPSGVYYVQLQVANSVRSTIRISLLR